MGTTDRSTPVISDLPPQAAPAAALGSAPHEPSRVWVWVLVVCAIQVAVWTAWFIFAAHHPVEEIPVATESRRSGVN